jgi:hypothetical protein
MSIIFTDLRVSYPIQQGICEKQINQFIERDIVSELLKLCNDPAYYEVIAKRQSVGAIDSRFCYFDIV